MIVDVEVAQSKYEHGTRARYSLGKCRCDACRKANNEYQKSRDHKAAEAARAIGYTGNHRTIHHQKVQGGKLVNHVFKRACPGVDGTCAWNAYLRKDSGNVCCNCMYRLDRIPTDKVREHVKKLSEQGVGYKCVADAAKVATSTLLNIMNGTSERVTPEVARRLLEVTFEAASDRTIMFADKTHQMLDEIRSFGLTWEEIAEYLNISVSSAAALRKRDRVYLGTQHKVEKILKQVRENQSESAYCPQHETYHYGNVCPYDMEHFTKKQFPTPGTRQALLRKIIPPEKLKAMSFDDVRELRLGLPKLYGSPGRGDAGYRLLHRDLTAIGYASTRKPRKDSE